MRGERCQSGLSSAQSMAAMSAHRSISAFTLIEVLVVVSIMVIIMGLLIPTINMVRENARKTEANQTITQMIASMTLYQNEDGRKRLPYPGPFADNSNPYSGAATTYFRSSADELAFSMAFGDQRGGDAIPGVLQLLDDAGQALPTLRLDRTDEDRRALDPWGRPYRYRLGLPAAVRSTFSGAHGSGIAILSDWNWDEINNREAKRSGRDVLVATPYPYIYSWSGKGTATDPSFWIYRSDRR